jgi:hypothetical protein
MPNDPEKAIEYVRIFLPGFLCLGLISYVTGLSLRDLSFAYVAVALSLGIYALTDGLMALWTLLKRSKRTPPKGEAALELPVPELPDSASTSVKLLFTTVVAGLAALVIIALLESQLVVSTVHQLMRTVVLRDDTRMPLRSLLHAEAAKRNHELKANFDGRRPPFRMSLDAKGYPEPYSLYVRVAVDTNTAYEGRILRFDTETPTADATPFILSPACRVVPKAGAGEQFVRIMGPGVYVTGKDMKWIELLEAEASYCNKCFQAVGGKRPAGNCVDSHEFPGIQPAGSKP